MRKRRSIPVVSLYYVILCLFFCVLIPSRCSFRFGSLIVLVYTRYNYTFNILCLLLFFCYFKSLYNSFHILIVIIPDYEYSAPSVFVYWRFFRRQVPPDTYNKYRDYLLLQTIFCVRSLHVMAFVM